MMPKRLITDAQLGQFYSTVLAIQSRLGRLLPYDVAMEALQHLAAGTLRIGFNTTEDVQQLFARPLGAEIHLIHFREGVIPVFPEKLSKDCFTNKTRFPAGFTATTTVLPDVVLGQGGGSVRVFKMKGMASYAMLAAELLGVSNETPTSWLQQLLIRRGHTLSLTGVEGIIELYARGDDIGLAPSRSRDKPTLHPGNLAFVEIARGCVDVVHFDRETSKRWKVSQYPFDQGGQSRRDDKHLVIRS